MIDYENIKWGSEEDNMSDIFFKIFIRLAERNFIDSDHDHDELTEFVKKHKFREILKSLEEDMLQDNLLDEYHSTMKEEPLSEKLKPLKVQAHDLIYTELGLNKSN